MFGPKKADSTSSEESVTADEVYFSKPVSYAYDAYQEKLNNKVPDGDAGSGSIPGGTSRKAFVHSLVLEQGMTRASTMEGGLRNS